MITTHPSAQVEDPNATYDLRTSISRAAAVVNFRTPPTDSWTEQRHMEWKSAQERARSRPTAQITSAQMLISCRDE